MTTLRLAPHLNRPSRKRRLFVGGIGWDNGIVVKALRVGKKNTIVHRFRTPGGGAANNALLHRQLNSNAECVLLAPLGDDPEGRELRACMEARGVRMPCPAVPNTTTSVSFAITEQAGGTTTILNEGGARCKPLPLNLLEELLPESQVCCLVSPWVNEQIAPTVRACWAAGVPLVFGLGRRQVGDLGYAALRDALAAGLKLLICNREEARQLTGEDNVAAQLDALRFDGRAAWVVITDGPNGLFAARDGQILHVPTYQDPGRPFVDALGAGDACMAGIVHAWLDGYPPEDALRAGARLGFEACTSYGGTPRCDGQGLRDYLSICWRVPA
jgi:sugar/nucleoside kinase (ribokinase family)